MNSTVVITHIEITSKMSARRYLYHIMMMIIKKWNQMITISYNAVKWSLDYIITIMVEIRSKNGAR